MTETASDRNVETHEPISIEEIRAARARIAPHVVRTPLVRLDVEGAPGEIWLKLENLQPINAYKLRGAANAVAMLSESERKRGVWTLRDMARSEQRDFTEEQILDHLKERTNG